MNLIQEEFNESKKLKFDMLTNSLVEINRKNVALVEAMIRNDSAYLKSSNKQAQPKYSKNNNLVYPGSTAYWMSVLKDVLFKGKKINNYYELIKNVVSAIDRENSTHLNADLVGVEQISKRIADIKKQTLIKYLKTPTSKFELISIISEKTQPKTKQHKPRTNYSFATKFCHYACFYLFENEKEQDNFSIFDGVMEKSIMQYVNYYHIKNGVEKINKADLQDYKTFINVVDEVRKNASVEVSRNGLDHLLWYYYKGRD